MNLKYVLYGSIAFSLINLFSVLLAEETESVVALPDYTVVGQYLQTDQINALKSPTPISEVPQSVSILNSDLIALQNLSSMTDISDYVPGLESGQGEGHRDDILFRGRKSTADFFVDGVRDDVPYYRPLYNVEQVEVLKGANALFFGRGGTGGLINRVTKTAQIADNFTNYKLSFDDLGERSLQLDTNVSISPNAAFRLNYYKEDLENHRDFYYGENSGFNPTLKSVLSDKTVLNVFYEHLEHERFIDRGIPSQNGAPVSSLVNTTFADTEGHNVSTLNADVLKINLDHRLDNQTKLRFNYTDNRYDKLYQNYYVGAYGTSYDSVPTVTPEGQVSMSGYKDTTQRESTILSVDLIGEKQIFSLNHKYALGYEVINTSNHNDRVKAASTLVNIADVGSIGSTAPFSATFSDDTHASLNVTSLYFSNEIAFSDELELILGGRRDEFELKVVDQTPTNASGGDAQRKDEAFSPRLGFVYKPDGNTTYYASYSETFIPQSGDQYADLKGDKRNMDPDVYESTEFGVKFDLENGMSVTAAKFKLNEVAPNGPPNTVNYAIEETAINGYEIQAVGNVSENWFIHAGASFISDADSIKEVPGRTLSVWNLYKVNEKLSLGLGIINKGSTAGKSSKVILPSYTRIDAAAYYKIDDTVRVQINLENATDELYYPFAYGDHQVSVGAPLHATIKLVGRF